MSLEDILGEVEQRAQSESEAVRKEYQDKISRLKEELEARRKAIESQWEKKIEEDSLFFKAREQDLILVEVRRIMDERRNEIVMEAFGRGKAIMEKIISGQEGPYIPGLMLNLCREKLGKDVIVNCSDALAKSLKSDVKFKALPSGMKGMLCTSPDQKEELDLTLESILSDVRDEILMQISSRIR